MDPNQATLLLVIAGLFLMALAFVLEPTNPRRVCHILSTIAFGVALVLAVIAL